jgi:hypothetical protein
MDHGKGLTRRRFLIFSGAMALTPKLPDLQAIQEYRNAVEGFWLTGPHGPVPDLLVHLCGPNLLEERLEQAGGDTERFWELIEMVRTERYFDDLDYAREIHRALLALA